ncbi:host attachment protein [Sulfuriferula sp. GW1]|uniref:host attachment protein n=1 Tax=Sulfuriferula sp. GW1 TaxID=3345111 RepID=UPI0039B06C60
MTTTWIVVANASLARLYTNNGPKQGLQLLKELNHPESREKASELVSDRPGHNPGTGNGHGSFVPATDPKQHEAERFAQELSKELECGRASNHYERLIMVASSPFIGVLNQRLTGHVRNMVSDTIEKDYTRATPKELSGHLEHCIYL